MPLPSELVFIVGCYLRVDTLLRAAHATHHLALKKVTEACAVKVMCCEREFKRNSSCCTLVEEHRPTWKELHGRIALTKDNHVQRFDNKHFVAPITSELRSVVYHWEGLSSKMLYLNDKQELRLTEYVSSREQYDLLIRKEVQWAQYSAASNDQSSISGCHPNTEKGDIFIRTTSGSIFCSNNMGKDWSKMGYNHDTITDIYCFDQGYHRRDLVLCKENLYVYNGWSGRGSKDAKPYDTGVLALVPYNKYLFYIRRNGQIVRWDDHGTIIYERDFLVVPYLNSYLIVHMTFGIVAYHPSELVKYLKRRDHMSLEFVHDRCSSPD